MPEEKMSKRTFLKTAAGALWGVAAAAQSRPPNVVLINADDLGYGDLSCYGSGIRTPNLDRMAEQGVRFTQFYSASPVCSPSRAALMTGRYPTRTGVASVLTPNDTCGLPDSETTIAQSLKQAGYRSMCIGKWHLGSAPQFLPTRRGFDEYLGIPYSNDMTPMKLLQNTEVIEDPVDLTSLATRYTRTAVDFINRSRTSPFFLYLAHHMPHLPLSPSARFRCASGLGLYGDSVMELDWSVGQVLRAIAANRLSGSTLVMFTSDNGPWYQGSSGRLQGRKGQTYEGGVREPFIARLPGRIPAGRVCGGVASTHGPSPDRDPASRRSHSLGTRSMESTSGLCSAASRKRSIGTYCSTSMIGTSSARGLASGNCTSPDTTASLGRQLRRRAASICRSATRNSSTSRLTRGRPTT